jgi:tungstate transport system substrate-binding protein
MADRTSIVILIAVVLGASSCASRVGESDATPAGRNPGVVRAAVIGGMTMTGLWDEIARIFQAESGYRVKLVVSGERRVIAEAFREGRADLLTMHSSDFTTDLVADGFGVNMRPWARNEHVIMGPPSDPAGIRGMRDGAAALRKIAESESPFVDSRGIGSRGICHELWKRADIVPKGDWVLKDESAGRLHIVAFAERKQAYVVTGRIPILFNKTPRGHMVVMVEGDPTMRRPYVVMEVNPERFPGANAQGAKALSDFLLSEEVQGFLAGFGAAEPGGLPLFYPVASIP